MTISERERSVAFLRATDRAVAETVSAVKVTDAAGRDCGAQAWALTDRPRPLLWDANHLYVDDVGDADAAALARAAADAMLAAGVSLGGVVVAPPGAGERLQAPFAQLGWRAGPLLLMVHRHPARLSATGDARRLSEADAVAARRAVILAEDWGSDEVADQVLGRDALITATARGVSYGADHAGAVASTCVVLHGEALAQIDDVGTVPAARGRGLAGAVVSFATERAREAAPLVFLCADALDWPRHLYARLGFEPIGVLHRFFPVFPPPDGGPATGRR